MRDEQNIIETALQQASKAAKADLGKGLSEAAGSDGTITKADLEELVHDAVSRIDKRIAALETKIDETLSEIKNLAEILRGRENLLHALEKRAGLPLSENYSEYLIEKVLEDQGRERPAKGFLDGELGEIERLRITAWEAIAESKIARANEACESIAEKLNIGIDELEELDRAVKDGTFPDFERFDKVAAWEEGSFECRAAVSGSLYYEIEVAKSDKVPEAVEKTGGDWAFKVLVTDMDDQQDILDSGFEFAATKEEAQATAYARLADKFAGAREAEARIAASEMLSQNVKQPMTFPKPEQFEWDGAQYQAKAMEVTCMGEIEVKVAIQPFGDESYAVSVDTTETKGTFCVNIYAEKQEYARSSDCASSLGKAYEKALDLAGGLTRIANGEPGTEARDLEKRFCLDQRMLRNPQETALQASMRPVPDKNLAR